MSTLHCMLERNRNFAAEEKSILIKPDWYAEYKVRDRNGKELLG